MRKYIFICVLSVFFVACRSGKKAARKPTVKLPAPKEFFKQYTERPDIETLDISKMSMSLRIGDKSFSTKGFIRLIADSVVVISAQPFAGIELFRAYITPSDVTVLDRTKSQYYTGSTDMLKEMTGIDFDFETLQALLCNYAFLPQTEDEELSKDMFTFNKYTDGYELTASDKYNVSFIINKHLQLEKTTVTDKELPYSLTCDYADFVTTELVDFPNTIKFTIFDGQKSQQVEIKVNKVSFNNPVNATLAVPAKYKEISVDSLMD